MKTVNAIKSYIFSACTFFAFFELIIFLVGSQVTTFRDAITFATAGIIFAFGAIVAALNYIFRIEKLRPSLRLLIHFVALGICFFILFTLVGAISIDDGIGDVFIMFAIYLFLYAVIFAVVYGIGRALGAIGKRLPAAPAVKSVKNSKKGNSEEYKSLFSSKDS